MFRKLKIEKKAFMIPPPFVLHFAFITLFFFGKDNEKKKKRKEKIIGK